MTTKTWTKGDGIEISQVNTKIHINQSQNTGIDFYFSIINDNQFLSKYSYLELSYSYAHNDPPPTIFHQERIDIGNEHSIFIPGTHLPHLSNMYFSVRGVSKIKGSDGKYIPSRTDPDTTKEPLIGPWNCYDKSFTSPGDGNTDNLPSALEVIINFIFDNVYGNEKYARVFIGYEANVTGSNAVGSVEARGKGGQQLLKPSESPIEVIAGGYT